METYMLLKTVHIIGAIILLGNIIVTAVWKAMADRTNNPQIISFAQRLVTRTDFLFTLPGVILLLATGDFIAYTMMSDSWSIPWIFWGRVLFTTTGLIWVLVLVPIQIKQAKLARGFADGSDIPERYWQLNRLWMIFGSIAVILPLMAVPIMVIKPV